MRARQSPADALIGLSRLPDASERLSSFRRAVSALGANVRVTGPPPLDGMDPGSLSKAIQVAVDSKFVDELDWIAPGPAAVALYELMIALPAGNLRRELGRRVLTRLYEGTGATFAAVATRMALGTGKALDPATMRARVSLVLDMPIGSTVDADALALSLATRRELAERWLARPSFGALPARRLSALILEHAAREAVMRSREGDPLPKETLSGELMRPVRRRLLADREPLVWRHAAISRGLLAAVDPRLREQIDLALDPQLSPTEWRRAAVSLVATLIADREEGVKACARLLKSEIVKRDPGLCASMVWGLTRVIEAEPDAAEAVLELLSQSFRPDVAEAVAGLLGEVNQPSFGIRAAASLRSVLASKLDKDSPVLRGITERALMLLDRDRANDGVAEPLRQAMVAYETSGARTAYEHAVEALRQAQGSLERLTALGDDEGSLAESLKLLTDLDHSVLERSRLFDLLLLGRRPGEADATLPEMDRLFDKLGSWLVQAEEESARSEWSRDASVGNQRRLRALLHMVDVETAHGEADDLSSRLRTRVRRACDVLLTRLGQGPDASVHRIVCATLARAFDAAVREAIAEPSDVFLLVASQISDRLGVATLTEASTNEDVSSVLRAYAEFLDADAPSSRVDGGHDLEAISLVGRDDARDAARRLMRLSNGLAASGSYRGEALRSTILRLARALETVVGARALDELVDTASGASTIAEIETAIESLIKLSHGARRRVLDREPETAVVVEDVADLSALAERAVSSGAPPDGTSIALSLGELTHELPEPIARTISAVLSRIGTLPVSAPVEVLAIPLERRRARLPDWLLPRRTIGAFYVVRALGSGGGSSVFVARRIEDRHDQKAEAFALKVPQYDPTTARSLSEQEFMQLFRDEAGALLSLPHHENLARFVTFDLAARPKPILVMELIAGTALDRMVRSRSLDMPRVFEYMDGILSGLEAMHVAGVGHLDVKPSNVILRNSLTPVLVDFGLSGRQLRPGCGTLEYCAPEVIGVSVGPETPSPLAADVYAFACTAFELLTGEHLFHAPDETALISQQISHDGWPDKLAELGQATELREVAVLLAACLRRDPRARPTVSEARKALPDLAKSLGRLPWPCTKEARAEQKGAE
jgi:hypothetical protein